MKRWTNCILWTMLVISPAVAFAGYYQNTSTPVAGNPSYVTGFMVGDSEIRSSTSNVSSVMHKIDHFGNVTSSGAASYYGITTTTFTVTSSVTFATMTVTGTITLTTTTVNGNITVNGKATATNFSGDGSLLVNVVGNTTDALKLEGGTMKGPMDMGGFPLTSVGSMTIQGAFTSTAAAVNLTTTTVLGATTLSTATVGGLTAGYLNVSGTVTFAGAVSTLTVQAQMINGYLNVNGTTTLSGKSTFSGGVSTFTVDAQTINGYLNVNGTSTFTGTISTFTAQAEIINGYLNVNSSAVLNSDLRVVGNSTFTGTTALSGNVTMFKTLTISTAGIINIPDGNNTIQKNSRGELEIENADGVQTSSETIRIRSQGGTNDSTLILETVNSAGGNKDTITMNRTSGTMKFAVLNSTVMVLDGTAGMPVTVGSMTVDGGMMDRGYLSVAGSSTVNGNMTVNQTLTGSTATFNGEVRVFGIGSTSPGGIRSFNLSAVSTGVYNPNGIIWYVGNTAGTSMTQQNNLGGFSINAGTQFFSVTSTNILSNAGIAGGPSTTTINGNALINGDVTAGRFRGNGAELTNLPSGGGGGGKTNVGLSWSLDGDMFIATTTKMGIAAQTLPYSATYSTASFYVDTAPLGASTTALQIAFAVDGSTSNGFNQTFNIANNSTSTITGFSPVIISTGQTIGIYILSVGTNTAGGSNTRISLRGTQP